MNRKAYFLLIGIIIFGLNFVGCKKGEADLKFSHNLHVVENEVECSQCHKANDEGKMENPDMDTCGECHDIGDTDSPNKDCLMCHTVNSSKKDYEVSEGVNPKPESYYDLIFTHEPHEDVDCNKCHEGINKNKSLKSIKWPKMDTCKECHDGDTAPISCETCHTKVRKEIPPENHGGDWEANHGFTSKFDDSCRFCHDKNFEKNGKFCIDCHTTKKPKDHIFNWKTGQHGMEATLDRNKCTVCHTASYCVDCHKSQKPFSHKVGNWMAFSPENGHAEAAIENFRSCNVCHTTSDCMKCHKSIILRTP
jgi:hypothetical protein